MLELLEKQPMPTTAEIAILIKIIEKAGLDVSAVWALIDAFNFGVIAGKQEERGKK